MRTHRFYSITAWLSLLLALIIYPGFEVKGLLFGVIIGCWPFLIWGIPPFAIALFSMLVLSGIQVSLCAWLMDKTHISRRYIFVVALFILTGSIIAYGLNVGHFDQWKYGVVSLVMPEGHEITISDFRRDYLIPVSIVGGIFGLYLAVAIGALLAAGNKLLKMHRTSSCTLRRAKRRLSLIHDVGQKK
jgi:hypothetical protein